MRTAHGQSLMTPSSTSRLRQKRSPPDGRGRLATPDLIAHADWNCGSPELLLLVRDTRWQGCYVPVDVGVALFAPEAQDVKAFGAQDRADGAAHPVHEGLRSQVCRLVEVGDDIFFVLERRHQDVARQGRVALQTGDGEVVAIDNVMGVSAGDELTDEARPVCTLSTQASASK